MIVLAGTIGAGKTSLTQMLAEHLGTKAYYESVDDNPILPLFYQDPQKYGFLLQIYFLNRRLDEIKEAAQHKLSVMDRLIWAGRRGRKPIFTPHCWGICWKNYRTNH